MTFFMSPGRQKLPLFDVDRQTTLRHRTDEIGLAAQEGRVFAAHPPQRSPGDLIFSVDIGQHGQRSAHV
jgi:hypothetical protein